MVFLRSLSSEPDSGGKPSTQIDVNVQDTAEDVDKELDAVVAGQRISWKGKNSSVNGLKDSMRSVGRLVPDKILNLLDEDGELLGSLRREEAIRRSQKSGLKLVLVNSKSMPYPTYRLMTGKHLHEEQMLLREKLRKTSAPTQVKEVRLSGNIAKHDLEVKQRHVQGWLKEGETHVHVRVTVMGKGKGQKKITKEQQMAVVHQVMSGMEDRVTFANKPRDFGKDGMNLSVVLRPMSAKEKTTMVRQKNIEESMKQTKAVGNSSEEGEGVEQGRVANILEGLAKL